MSKLERIERHDNAGHPERGDWPAVVSLAVTATAVTLTAIFTDSVELAALVGTLLRPR